MKKVLITGGSRGIGSATVERFYQEGWQIAFCYRQDASSADALCQRLPGVLALQADLSLPADCERLVQEATRQLGRLDALVLNAGASLQALLTDTSLEQWEALFAVNLRSAFLCCRAALPDMIRKQQGSIVTVSSMWGEVGASCEVAYSASKAGLIGLTKALAKEVGPSGIRVNCVSPGVIDTDMNHALSAEDLKTLQDDTPLSQIGLPAQVADAIFYLSTSASFVTGQVLGVNGGLVI